MCAGLLLCPPQFYYNSSENITTDLFQKVYGVPGCCARTRMDILQKYKDEIKSCKLYQALPQVNYIRKVAPTQWNYPEFKPVEFALV